LASFIILGSNVPEKIRVFVDFWNFQLEWNDRSQGQRLNWAALPTELVNRALAVTGIADYQYDGTRVYASVDMTRPTGGRLKHWLNSFIDRQPGVNVHISERRPRARPIHCRACDSHINDCPNCNQPFLKSAEKGVDASIVTDLFSLAWANSYSMAILVSSDGDFVPAVENLQAKGFKIINATWHNLGYHLARTCWASYEVDALIPSLVRPQP
jgi:uncharacterized LabA/DUF88 family protein